MSQHTVSLMPEKFLVFSSREILHYVGRSGLVVCVYDVKSRVGGAVVLVKSDFERSETCVRRLIMQVRTKSGSESLSAKVVSYLPMPDWLQEMLSQNNVPDVKTAETAGYYQEIFFYTEDGRLRLRFSDKPLAQEPPAVVPSPPQQRGPKA